MLFDAQHVRASLVVRVAVAVGMYPNTKHRLQPQIVVADTAYRVSLPNSALSFSSLQPTLHNDPLRHLLAVPFATSCTSCHSPHHLPANRWNATADSTRHDPPLYLTSRVYAQCQTSYLQCSSLPLPVRTPYFLRSPSLFTPSPPSSRARAA
jgi:hypothetical protein